MLIDLDQFLPHLPVWLLVFFRLTGVFVFAPLFASTLIPVQVRVFWALTLSLCVYPVLLHRPATAALLQPLLSADLSLWTLPAMVAMELAVGVLIGYGASITLVGMQMAGQIADQQLGLGLGGIFNPDLSEQSGAISEFYYMMALALFLILGGHRFLIQTLLHSFDQVPLGSFFVDQRVIDLLIGLLGVMFELALRVAAPLLCLIFLETVAMGFIARTVPQLNIMTIGFPVRILIGVGILIATLASQTTLLIHYFRLSLRAVAGFCGM